MTPERIEELRERAAWVRANKYSALTIDLDIVDALLAECERTYTSELPKVSGWYWRKQEGQVHEDVVEVTRALNVLSDGSKPRHVSRFVGCRWSGPLTPPAGAQP